MSSIRNDAPVTRLCTHTLTSLHYRDADLVEDLMGQKTFTEVMLMQIMGRTPRPVDLRITDVVLIVLMEHGLTPSAIATRLIYMSAPENLQGAVSAGLLAVGTPISPSSAATAPVALMVMGRPATSSTAWDSVSSARTWLPARSGSARASSSSL